MRMTAVSYQELDSLSGELLPPRVLLSLINLTFDNRRYDVHMPEGGSGGGDGGTTVAYACQATTTQGTGGLIGSLGLGQAPGRTMTCIPAAVASHH
jgi:hypothetical protein